MSGGPYSIGSDVWPGLAKLIEEAGEVQQVAAKLMALGGDSTQPREFYGHWDGTNVRDRLEEELGDLRAAIDFVITCNGLDEGLVMTQAVAKIVRFRQWHEEQSGEEVSSDRSV